MDSVIENGQEYLVLPNSCKMPLLGYGTFLSQDSEQLKIALRAAIDAGYRHIDTAHIYGNESVIGEVLQEYFSSNKLKRSDIFITTKLWGNLQSTKELIRKGIEGSLKRLQLNYIDLYLVHTPMSFAFESEDKFFVCDKNDVIIAENPDLVDIVWRGMEDLVDAGLAKSIGVSNFNSQQIERIHKVAKHPIATNQIEVHVLHQQHKLVDFCQKRNITITAYSPLGAPGFHSRPDDPETNPLENHIVKQLAEKYGKTTAQILLRFLVDRNISPIPKSVTPNRVMENFNVFDFKLDGIDMEKLKTLDCHLRIFKQNFLKGLTDHPEYPFNIEF